MQNKTERLLAAENRLWDYALADENRATPRGAKAIAKATELNDRANNTCHFCNGTGRSRFNLWGKDIPQPDCGACGGTGKLEDSRDTSLDTPNRIAQRGL